MFLPPSFLAIPGFSFRRGLRRSGGRSPRCLLAVFFITSVLLTACGGHLHHVVEPGETLYSIGFLYGYDYRKIAQWNHIHPPYSLSAGQVLQVVPPGTAGLPARSPAKLSTKSSTKPPSTRPAPVVESVKPVPRSTATAKAPIVESVAPESTKVQGRGRGHYSPTTPQWRWPLDSRKLLRTFSAADPARQGVDISAPRGKPVYAAATGKVVYAGSGLARYGQLVIVKHNEKYLSAYAHNDKLRVREGDVVKVGERIADVGSTGAKRPMLHFEIRRNGKPVNPLRYLPKH